MHKKKQSDGKKLLCFSMAIFLLVIAITVSVVKSYFDVFKTLPTGRTQSVTDPAAVWGQFGDYVGGLINPVVGVATVLLIIITIILQRTELKNSIEELRNSNAAIAVQNKQMALQGFEQTFFAWLGSYRELVNSISTMDTGQIGGIYVNGRNALQFWRSQNFSEYQLLTENKIVVEELISTSQNATDTTLKLERVIKTKFSNKEQMDALDWKILSQSSLKLWENTYSASEIHTDSMFRTAYRLIRFIDEQSEDILDKQSKWKYVSIVRAQLSFIEMEYLFYNGFTKRGENFVQYINKYALFDNFRPQQNVYFEILKNSVLNPYVPSAFDSEVARQPSESVSAACIPQ